MIKPPRWNIAPALIAPQFRSLWRDAIVCPLWEGGGSRIFTYPGLKENLGTGTFPLWAGTALRFTAASSQFVDLATSLEVSSGMAMSVLSVFRSSSETAQTMYGEGNSGTNNMIFNQQLRGDQAENYVRSFLRGNTGGGGTPDHNTNGSGINYADGEWHACATTYRNANVAGGDFAGRIDGVNSFVTDASSGGAPTVRDPNQISLGSLNRVANAEFFDGDITFLVLWPRGLTNTELTIVSNDPFGMLRPDKTALAVFVNLLLPAPGVEVNRELQDAFAFAEQTVTEDVFTRPLTDSSTFAESLTRARIYLQQHADSFIFADQTLTGDVPTRSLQDSLAFTDQLNTALLTPHAHILTYLIREEIP